MSYESRTGPYEVRYSYYPTPLETVEIQPTLEETPTQVLGKIALSTIFTASGMPVGGSEALNWTLAATAGVIEAGDRLKQR